MGENEVSCNKELGPQMRADNAVLETVYLIDTPCGIALVNGMIMVDAYVKNHVECGGNDRLKFSISPSAAKGLRDFLLLTSAGA